MLRVLLIFTIGAGFCVSQCPDHAFLGCVLRLKAQRVPFERNILNLVFSVRTEAKLLHSCKVYSTTLPCFREKVAECGDEKQRRLLNEVGKMLIFLCSPFSLQTQRSVIEHRECITSVLSMPASTGCKLTDHPDGRNVLQCKEKCARQPNDFICMMRTWISEQNVCTLKDIDGKCGQSAAKVYREMQETVFEPEFPVLCDFESGTRTVATIEIASTKKTPTTTDLVKHNIQVFRKLPTTEQKVSTTSAPSINFHRPQIWTKKPTDQKTIYNQHVWRKPVVASNRLQYTSTAVPEATPKSYKVITLLRNLLPEHLPSRLSSLFETSLLGAKASSRQPFDPREHYHTPGVALTKTYSTQHQNTARPYAQTQPYTEMTYPTRKTTTVVTTTSPSTRTSWATQRTTKWKPWYLAGTE